jgi:RNA polymerase sigma-54 factor
MTLQPQQILRSELLQLAALELEMRIKAELEENPFLEETDPTDVEEDETSEEASEESTDVGLEEEEEDPTEKPGQLESREVDWDDILNDTDHWEYRPQTRPTGVELNPEIPQPSVPSLSELLYEQLHFDNLTPTEVEIGEQIIGNINRDGYLEVTLEEVAATTKQPLEEVVKVHRRILDYDPAGIGARDLRECLLVQLRRREPPAPLAERMLRECWEDFTNKRFEIIAQKLGVEPETVKTAFQVVARLNPKPGEGYWDEKTNYVIPDLVVTRVGEEFEVFLSEGDIPNFRVNPRYRDMYLSRKGTDKQVREFLSRKFESARWFINAIHQRRTTMMRTMHAIVDRQREFFLKGPAQLKPMILAAIAQDIGLDISTISRVTNGKYVQTDWGIFELKYFFSEKMSTDEGEDVSNRVIKARLKEMIDGEDKLKPLSDQELTAILNKDGFQIRRRTVAKYREQMRIPIKRLRREI